MTTPVEYFLTFGGTPVGKRLHGFGQPQIALVTEPKVLHPFWWKSVIIDGRYTAASYTWPFSVIFQEDDEQQYMESFYNLESLTGSNTTAPTEAQTLLMTRVATALNGDIVPGDPVMTFGQCFFSGASAIEPTDIMITSVGLVEVRFMGSTRPVLLD